MWKLYETQRTVLTSTNHRIKHIHERAFWKCSLYADDLGSTFEYNG